MKRFPLVLLLGLLLLSVGPTSHAASVFRLQLKVTGLAGSVSPYPGGAFRGCNGSWCTYAYLPGQHVSLFALRSTFPQARPAKWLGACSAATTTRCDLTLDGNKVVVARFTPVPLYVDLPEGRGTPHYSVPGADCGAGCTAYAYGTQVGVTVEACCGYAFDGWSGDCHVSAATCWVKLFGDSVATPGFHCVSCAPVATSPLDRSTTVSVTIQGSGSIQLDGRTCTKGSDCHVTVNRGDAVDLVVLPGASFRRWDGPCSHAGLRCAFAARRGPNGDGPQVTAYFS